MASFVSRDDVLTAEILWAIKTVMSHYSCSSSAHTDMLFKRMFRPDSQIACRFACGETKCSYLFRFGLAPFFDKEVLDAVSRPGNVFVVSFDEVFNKFLQKSQMDLILRFWDDKKKQELCGDWGTMIPNIWATHEQMTCYTKWKKSFQTVILKYPPNLNGWPQHQLVSFWETSSGKTWEWPWFANISQCG